MKPLSETQSATKQTQPNSKATSAIKQSKNHHSRYKEQPWGFTISNHKKIQLEKLRQIEMDRENKSLGNRMMDIERKRRNSLHNQLESIYLKHTLNASIRKEHNRIRLEENEGHKKRLKNLTAIVNVKKLEKEWQNRQSFKKILQKHYRDQNKTKSRSIDLCKIEYSNVSQERSIRYCKDRVLNGVKILIKIEQFYSDFLVSGLIREKDMFMFMVIEKDKIKEILQKECKGKIQNFGNFLKFDLQTNSLYYMAQQSPKGQCFITDKCSQFQIKQLRLQFRRQFIQMNRKEQKKDKQTIKGEINNEHKQKLTQQPQNKTKEATTII